STASPDGSAEGELVPTLVRQWVRAIRNAKGDSGSILTPWRQFMSDRKLNADSANPDNGVERILGSSQPESFVELAGRYDRLFEDVRLDSAELAKSESGNAAKTLSDAVLENARKFLSNSKSPFNAPNDIESAYSKDVVDELKALRDEMVAREAVVPKYTE